MPWWITRGILEVETPFENAIKGKIEEKRGKEENMNVNLHRPNYTV